MTNLLKKTKNFFLEVVGELKKSTWPRWKDLSKSTMVVIVGMLLLSFYISVVDFSLLNLVDFVSKWAKK